MLRKENFAPGQYYHIYNRTIFNLPEFKNQKNAERLMQAFILANSTKSSLAFDYLRNNKNILFEKAVEISQRGERLADILCYVIMPDHYHLLLKEIREGGISNFVHKCNISVAKYINIKNNRTGPLFESLFKSKHISTDEYLLHLSLYIHLNPLDIISGREWRSHGLRNWDFVKNQLLDYNWSSLKYFLNENYIDPVISGTEIIMEQFDDSKDYEKFLRSWSEDSLNIVNNFSLE